MTINFLKYTITIYPRHNDSLVKKMKEKKLSGNQKLKKKNTVILSGTTNNQLD